MQLLLSPVRIAIRVAEEAGVRAFLLAEALGQVRRGDFDLVRAGLKQERVHDARHVAGDALAGFGSCGVVSMSGEIAAILGVTAEAHLVRVIFEF